MLRAVRPERRGSVRGVVAFAVRLSFIVTKIGAQRKPAPDAPLPINHGVDIYLIESRGGAAELLNVLVLKWTRTETTTALRTIVQCSYPNRGFSASISGNFVPVPRPPHLAFYTVYNLVPSVDFMVDVNGALIGR